MSWKVVASAVCGFGHSSTKTPCQDAVVWKSSGDWLVATVSDGAGSAPRSDFGAQTACSTIVESLITAIHSGHFNDMSCDPISWQPFISAGIDETRAKLRQESDIEDLSEFHATVVGVIANQDCGLLFHIGDGAGAAVYGLDWQNCIISPPENGEYADQTFFLTMNNWQNHLRVTLLQRRPDIILLMSDGAMSFVLARGLNGLDQQFIGPVHRFLSSVDIDHGKQALSATLDNPKTYAITSDDKTLFWAMWSN